MKHAAGLLASEPALAAEQAREVLKVVPNHAPAAFLLARASARLGRGDDAITALRQTVRLKPDHPEAWRLLADHLDAIGDTEDASAARLRHVKASTRNPELLQAAGAMVKKDLPRAEALLKAHLVKAPTDVAAIRMLAEVAARLGRDDDAIRLLERCLELAPNFQPALFNYATMLHRRNDSARALPVIEKLLAAEPRHPGYRNFHAVLLARLGEYARAGRIYSELLKEYPSQSKVWLSYGHTLKTDGKPKDGIDAYRRSIVLEPTFGEAYWSLANLKTFRFDAAEIAAMEAKVADPTVGDVDRLHIHFALGKAYEDEGDWAKSFEHYAKGNALNRARSKFDADHNTKRVQHLKATFTREFFTSRTGSGCPSPDPIFIVGLPRAGSTLIEQILSSHSAGRRHDGTARDDFDGAGTAGRVRIAGARRLYRRAGWPGCRPAARAR